MMREATGTIPRVYARYGTAGLPILWGIWLMDLELGREKQEMLSGRIYFHAILSGKLTEYCRTLGSTG